MTDDGDRAGGPPSEDDENAAPARRGDRLAATERWVSIVSKGFFMAAIAFTGWQYFQAIERDRMERTFALIELWDGERMQSAHWTVQRAIGEARRENETLFTAIIDSDERAVLNKQVGLYVFERANGREPDFALQESLDTVLYFLNRVAHCADTMLCSGEIVDRFFLDYARTYWTFFSEEYAVARPGGAEPLIAYLEAREEAGGAEDR